MWVLRALFAAARYGWPICAMLFGVRVGYAAVVNLMNDRPAFVGTGHDFEVAAKLSLVFFAALFLTCAINAAIARRSPD